MMVPYSLGRQRRPELHLIRLDPRSTPRTSDAMKDCEVWKACVLVQIFCEAKGRMHCASNVALRPRRLHRRGRRLLRLEAAHGLMLILLAAPERSTPSIPESFFCSSDLRKIDTAASPAQS